MPIEFLLFAATLVGVATFHRHTLAVSVTGLVVITSYKVVFGDIHGSPGLVGLVHHLHAEWVILANLFALLVGFALLSRHFEQSHLPGLMPRVLTRRSLLRGAGLAAPGLLLGGCDWLGARPSFRDIVLGSGEWLSYRTHRLIGSEALAREYEASEMSPKFRTNGNTMPRSPEYRRHLEEGFASWRLRRRVQRKPDPDPPGLLGDFVRYNFLRNWVGRDARRGV